MTSINVYYAGIPAKNKKEEKTQVLEKFAIGAKKFSENIVEEIKVATYKESDLAVIQGWVHEYSQTSPHLVFRKKVIDSQVKNQKRVLAIDSNLFLYKDHGNTKKYLRFSLDGIFPTTGNYFNSIVDPNHWKEIEKNLQISLRSWRTNGEHILICLQRNGGWSMQGLDVMTWCFETIKTIRKYSQRKIIVRGHPGDKATKNYLKLNLSNVSISSNQDILDDFKNAWATVTYNSSPGVASAIEGIPVFVTDPVAMNSQAFDVCNTDLKNIENPVMVDRQNWIEQIAMSHWNFDDLESGKAWEHMRKFI